MDYSFFTERLLHWYAYSGRNLPWRRKKRDPYVIWLSEIILQQTRIAQGEPYFLRFLNRFPTIHHLARATEEEVLRLWQGLGYYRRAVNMHRCARLVVDKWNAIFPADYNVLLSLPGIGPYTAGALGSIAFGLPVVAVDGNAYRVLSRIFGVKDPIDKSEGKKRFRELAHLLMQDANPGAFNEALMDFGALQCVPKSPNCGVCIFQNRCKAYLERSVESYPAKSRVVAIKERFLHYVVLRKGGGFYLRQRLKNDIWRGLYEFYLIEQPKQRKFKELGDLPPAIRFAYEKKWDLSFTHLLTHRLLHLNFFVCLLPDDVNLDNFLSQQNLTWFDEGTIANLPMPVALCRFLNHNTLP